MRKKLAVSLFANIIYVLISLGINFIAVPFIVEKLGSEAYGYNSISDNFVTYATIITTALNYMGCRFIAFEYHKNNKRESNRYFSSLFFGDVMLGFFLSVIFAIIIVNIDNLLIISYDLIKDVKITFTLTCMTFVMQIIMTAYTAGTYVKDRMDLYAFRNIIYTLIRAGVIWGLYLTYTPQIYYISLAAFIGNIFCALFDYISTKILIPELRIKKGCFSWEHIKSLISSGSWYSFVSLGTVLSSGLDLVIANQMIDSYNMGILAVSKTIVSAMNSVRTAIVNVFRPRLIKSYAQDSTEEFVNKVKKYMRIVAGILYVPLAGLIIFLIDFYRLWLPKYSEDEIRLVTALTLWALASTIASTATSCLPEVYAVVNKLKIPTIVNLIENMISLVLTFVLLKYTDYGVLVIASVSSVVFIIYQISFGIPYVSYLIQKQWWNFFPTVLLGLLSFGVILGSYYLVRQYVIIDSWIIFVKIVGICGIIGYVIAFFILTTKAEKQFILKQVLIRPNN